MKALTTAVAITIATVAPAQAATMEGAGFGLLTPAFFGFLALIVVFQAVPALLLFVGLVKGLFAEGNRTDVADIGTRASGK